MAIQTIDRGTSGDTGDKFKPGVAFDTCQSNDDYLELNKVGTVATFAALASTPATVGDVVYAKCHSTVGYGGGFLDAYSATHSATDNGLFINSATTGVRFKRRYDGMPTPQMFGALGDYSVDDTAAMQLAHNTGLTIFYPRGHYKFTTLTMHTGGIVGDGKLTILESTDTSTANLITYDGVDAGGLLVNEVGAIFRDFYLKVATKTTKSAGVGIYINSGTLNENYTSLLDNVTVRNIPTSVYCVNASYFTVRSCYFAFFSIYGLYMENTGSPAVPLTNFSDNGDNAIYGNAFFTDAAGSTAKCIAYKTGGGKIFGNKINGGAIGIDIAPLTSTSIALIYGNSIENQIVNAIRGYYDTGTPATDFTMINIYGNQVGGYNLTGPAISFNSATGDTFKDVSIENNTILCKATAANAIDIRYCDRFKVSNNKIDCVNSTSGGYGGIFVDTTAVNGKVDNNDVVRYVTNHTQITSTTCPETRLVVEYSGTYNPASIASLGNLNLGVTATGANFGDVVDVTYGGDLQGITLTGYVSSADTINFNFFNGTSGAIDLASATIRARVRKSK